MKKYFWIAAAALLLLNGCGTAGSSTAERTTAPAETQVTTETVTTEAVTPAAETTAAETTAETAETATTAAETDTPDEPEETEPQSAEQPAAEAPAEQDDGWKTAYLEKIRSSGAKRFTLAYIDDNDTPELVLHFTDADLSTHADSPTLYAYVDGAVKELGNYGENGFDYFGYLERRGIVVTNFSAQGKSQTTLYRLNNGVLEKACEFFSDLETFEYTMNGQPVTKEEIDTLLAEYGQDQHKSTNGDYQAAEAETVLGAG